MSLLLGWGKISQKNVTNFLLFQVPINALIADLSGFHLTKSQPPEQDFTGILWALAVPVLSATINIITRQVENNSTESFLVDLSMYIIHQAKHVHYSVFVFWFALSGLVVSISGLSWDMHDPFQVLLFYVSSQGCQL